MAVVANQAVAFDKSMLMTCPHLGDVLRPGLILDHGQTRNYLPGELRVADEFSISRNDENHKFGRLQGLGGD